MTEPESFPPRRGVRAPNGDGGAAADPRVDPERDPRRGLGRRRRDELADDAVRDERVDGSEEREAWFIPPPSDPLDADGVEVTPIPAVDGPDEDPDEPDEPSEERSSARSLVRELPVLILIAFVLAFLLRTFVVQVFYIPSSSMEPTLQVNDRILVDKVTYSFRDLDRGEIVVFEGDQGPVVPDAGPVESVLRGVGQLIGVTPVNARDFVKRVVGLPGDELYIDEDGTVFVNGEALDEPYIGQRDPRTCGPLTVPEGELFFLGDNRANSSDSRASLGLVSEEHVVGRAFLTIWPLDRVHLLDRPSYPDVPAATGAPPASAAAAGNDVCNP